MLKLARFFQASGFVEALDSVGSEHFLRFRRHLAPSEVVWQRVRPLPGFAARDGGAARGGALLDDGQAPAALEPPGAQHLAASASGHTLEKTMFPLTGYTFGLPGTFHETSSSHGNTSNNTPRRQGADDRLGLRHLASFAVKLSTQFYPLARISATCSGGWRVNPRLEAGGRQACLRRLPTPPQARATLVSARAGRLCGEASRRGFTRWPREKRTS